MALSNQELLRKAAVIMTPDDFGGAGEAPLSLEQADQFFELAITPQKLLPLVRVVNSKATKWQESKIGFDTRILRPGTYATRLAEDKRSKPTTGMIEISTVLVRGEVPIADEVYEDQVEREGFGNRVMGMLTRRVGADLEDLFINGDTTNVTDDFLALTDGWLKLAQGGNVVDAATLDQDYQSIFKKMVLALLPKYKQDKENMRFLVPTTLHELYVDKLAARGTPLGDFMLEGERQLKYQGIPIVPVPLFPVAAGTPDTSYCLLTHLQNLIAGYHRSVKIETFRDPREGATSVVVTTRVDAEIENLESIVVANNVNVEP